MSARPVIARLKKGREKPVLQKHPWVFSGAIDDWSSDPAPGSVADVHSSDGAWLARGIAHPGANLALRLYTWSKSEQIGRDLFRRRLEAAWRLRQDLFGADDRTDSYRVVFSESDGLSGLVVDRYADTLSLRVSALGIANALPSVVTDLAEITGIKKFAAAADQDGVEREGVDARAVASLSTHNAARARIRENGFAFDVDVSGGQKTGFYLDQRMNRARVAAYARGRRVLSAYCYTGAFEVAAAAGGAREITGLDSSQAALDGARAHHELNRTACPASYACADVPQAMRKFRDEGRSFDLVILDPPRFVMNAAQKDKGLRAYKDINLLGLKLLSPGGILATFSCSGLVSPADLGLAVTWAATDSGRRVRILETLGQPPDHPVLTSFPEAAYLCGYILHAE